MKTHLNANQAGSVLYGLGINYHNFGNLRDGRKIIGGWFECDKITTEQKESLQNQFSNVKFMRIQKQYAKEIIKPVILFLSKAEVKRQK